MSLLKFYVDLRKEIIAVIGGVEDSGHSLYWDNSTPNRVTKSELNKILKKCIKTSETHGVYLLNRHSCCPNPKHDQTAADGYVMDNIGDEKISYRDERFIWSYPIEQREVLCKCPCSENNLPSKHHVIQDVIFDVNADQNICKSIESIIYDIYQAILNSGDNCTRSSIREYLSRAVIKINDAILPSPMDEYIDHQLKLAEIS